MVFISARTFAGRWIAKPKPLVDNMLSVSRCYSSLNCINGAHWSGELFVFLSSVRVCWGWGVFICVCACGFWHCSGPFVFLTGMVAVIHFICQFSEKSVSNGKYQLRDLSVSSWLNRYQNHVFTFASPSLPCNTARGHIVKYSTHTKGYNCYSRNGYGYQKLLHINVYVF